MRSHEDRLKVSLSAWYKWKSEQRCCDSQEEEGGSRVWALTSVAVLLVSLSNGDKISWSPAWLGQPWCPGSTLPKRP